MSDSDESCAPGPAGRVPTTTGPLRPAKHKRAAPRPSLNTQPTTVQRAPLDTQPTAVQRPAPVVPPVPVEPAPVPPVVAELSPLEAAADPGPGPLAAPSPSAAASPDADPSAAPQPAPEAPPAPAPDDRAPRESFLADDDDHAPPTRGWRRTASALGIRVQPSAEERAERADIRSVSRHFRGARTVAIVNGKGGANKTPTTALLSAVFARYGGAGVLAWDNNETRGTLGWRTEQAAHDATVHDLLPHSAELLAPQASASDFQGFVHHQREDKYDVLRSNPRVLADQQRLTRAEFDALHQVARKYYRLLFLDSGNDESAERWQQMIERADAIVIATTALGEHAEAGALLLEQLAERGPRSAALAQAATVIVSQSDPDLGHGDAREVALRFRSLARSAVTIPFDDALHSGRIRYTALAPRTQRAWLHAAAQVADALATVPAPPSR